jgi:hypothetical protein
MTKNRHRLSFLTAVILLISGCASANLEVESAIYGQEPYESLKLDQDELLQQFIGIDRAEMAAAELASARLSLADRVTSASNWLWVAGYLVGLSI